MRTLVLAPDGRTEVEVPEMDDGFTGDDMDVAAGGPGMTTKELLSAYPDAKEQAIHLAKEALDVAKRTADLAERNEQECELALLELTGEEPLYAALLRARLSGTRDEHIAARVEFYADQFLRNGVPPPIEIADAVTERVAALRIERETH